MALLVFWRCAIKWYKHDSDASSDAKIKKLLLKHGAIGYAIYFHCLELIMSDFCETNITFELEHDAEIIADNLKIRGDTNESGIDIVNRVMHYIVELGLFEDHGGRITCMKLLKRLDTSMTSNDRLRKLITEAKESNGKMLIESCQSHDVVMIESCKTRRDQNREEKNRSIVEQSLDDTPKVALVHEKPALPIAETTREVVAYLNKEAGTKYNTEADGHRKLIGAMLKKGYTTLQMKQIIKIKAITWLHDDTMRVYLRPSTLFAPKHVDDYIGEYNTEYERSKE